MSLRPQQPIPLVPDDTARVARAAFRTRKPYLILRNRLGTLFTDADFADLYPKRGHPTAPRGTVSVLLLPEPQILPECDSMSQIMGSWGGRT